METDPSPVLKWSSRERSVPEVSMINDSSLKCQPTNFGFNPTHDPNTRIDFPLCSSPPHKATRGFNGSPHFVPPLPRWAPEEVKTPDLETLKTEILDALLHQNKNQFDLFKSEILNIVKKEQKSEIDEIRKGISLIKSELSNVLPNLTNEIFGMFEKMKLEMKSKKNPKKEVGIQIGNEKKDQSIQTDDIHFQEENIQDENEVLLRQAPKKPHEGFELRLVSDYEKINANDTNTQKGRPPKEWHSDNSESDEVNDRLSPIKRPMKRLGSKFATDCEMVQVNDFYNIQDPNQRGGYARVQELCMAGTNRNQPIIIPAEAPPSNDVSMATNAVLAKYLPPEKVAECQTPRRPNQQNAQDVVFNMTNVSFAMRYPAENDSPDVGYIYPPQNRHLKPNRFHEDRYESDDYYRQRRIIEDEWQNKPPRDILRPHPVPMPDRDRYRHGMNKENGRDIGYQEEYNYGRRNGYIGENKWGRGVPYRENFQVRPANWENLNNYPIPGRGQPPINNRILDITAIKNQPKLT